MPRTDKNLENVLVLGNSNITDISWRHFRFLLTNEKFIKIQKRIKNSKELSILLKRYRPKDVFYSVSCYLDPTSVIPRSKTEKYKSIILYSDIAFDIDFSPVSSFNLNRARKETLKLLKFMKKEPKYIAFSGSKGFHVIYEDKQDKISDPYEREMDIIKRRKTLVKKIKEADIRIDSAITVDTRRIIRLPGTINSKTGLACTIISRDDLEKGIKHILKKVHNSRGFKIKRYNLMGYLPKNYFWQKKKSVDDIKTYYSTYLSNTVLGVKNRYIPFILLRKNSFQKIMHEHSLPNILVFKVKEGFCGVSLKTFQKRELLRLLKRTGSANTNEFLKRKQNFLELDMTIPGEKQKIKKPVAVYTNDSDAYMSRGHTKFFSYCGLPVYKKLHGNNGVKLSYAIERA